MERQQRRRVGCAFACGLSSRSTTCWPPRAECCNLQSYKTTRNGSEAPGALGWRKPLLAIPFAGSSLLGKRDD